jgi:hypothetical protein
VQTETPRPIGPLVVGAVAGIVHLVVGYFYAVGGLVIPGYVLIPLWLFWAALALWLIRLIADRSWWTPVIPGVAAAVLALTLVVGGTVLGWQA